MTLFVASRSHPPDAFPPPLWALWGKASEGGPAGRFRLSAAKALIGKGSVTPDPRPAPQGRRERAPRCLANRPHPG